MRQQFAQRRSRFTIHDSLFTISLLLFLSACGYSASRLLPAAYRTLYVEPFENKIPITEEVSEYRGFQTNLPELEEKVTRGLINEFQFDGNLRITTKPEQADLILRGALIDFYRQPVRQLEDNAVEEYRLNLAARINLRDREGRPVFNEENLVGDTTYFVTGPSATSESAAVDKMITDFSRRVVERVVEDW